MAQNIEKVEYFIDSDPGYGVGTSVGLTAGTPLNLSFPVDVSFQEEGFHFLTIRAKDANNKWGMSLVRPFYVSSLSSALTSPSIVKMEYFIDADPGFGVATNIPVTAGSPITKNIAISLPGSLSDGFHFLTIRGKDENNKWSLSLVRPFYISSLSSSNSSSSIVKMEYFIDSDPGFGAATNVPVTAGSPITKNVGISLPGSLADGFHFLSLRAKDANGKWGLVLTRPFYKDRLAGNALPSIVQMEYFIDNDPGFGAATAVGVTPASEVSKNLMINLGSLSNGEHRLFIRAKGVNGRWSLVGMKAFSVQDDVVYASNVPDEWCKQTVFNIPFTAGGTFASNNVFTAQLSDANGDFSSPVDIGSLSGTTSGTITALIPAGVALGAGYKIRIVSSNPVVSNGTPYDFAILAECPPPCPTSITLANPTDNISSGTELLKASATGGFIEAANHINGNGTKATYSAEAYILLQPGFIVNSGAVFLTEFGGCNE